MMPRKMTWDTTDTLKYHGIIWHAFGVCHSKLHLLLSFPFLVPSEAFSVLCAFPGPHTD